MEYKSSYNETNKSCARFVGVVLTLSIILTYNLTFYNKYFPLSEGWFSVYAEYILRGKVPYRDFHFFMPPLYPLIMSGFIHIFGADFILLRLFGVFLILSMTSVLFLLFSRLFPAYIACFVSIVSIMFYQSNVAHITYDFLHFVTMFALLGTYFICKYYEADSSVKSKNTLSAIVFLFIAGLFGGFAFLTKQSNGFFVIVFSLLAVSICASSIENRRHALKSIAIYLIGVLVPILMILVWLIVNSAFFAFIEQVFYGGLESKGSVRTILFAWIPRLFREDSIIGLSVVFVGVVAMRYRSFLFDKLVDSNKREHLFPPVKTLVLFWVIFVLSSLSLFLPFWNVQLSQEVVNNWFLNWFFYRALIISTSTACSILLCVYLVKILKEKRKLYFDVFIISAVSMGLLYGTGTSGGAAEAGLLLASGLMFGHLLFVRSYLNIGKVVFFLVCFSLMLFLSSKKYIQPYYWWGLTQNDIRTAICPARNKYLDGFYLSNDCTRIYSEVNSIIEKYTKPGESIFTFPNIPVFYLLTNRYPNTFGVVHWFDVLPDKLAIDEVKRILYLPPKIIIFLDVPEWVWIEHEKVFFGERLSGQRRVANAVKRLISFEGRYSLEAEFAVKEGYFLRIWRRCES